MEAYLHGTSTRKVDDLVKALGADSGISKSEVSPDLQDLDTEVAAFRDRPLGDSASLCVPRCHLLQGPVNHRVISGRWSSPPSRRRRPPRGAGL